MTETTSMCNKEIEDNNAINLKDIRVIGLITSSVIKTLQNSDVTGNVEVK